MSEYKLPNAINLDLPNLTYDEQALLSGVDLFANGGETGRILQTKWDTIGNIDFLTLSQETWYVGNPCGDGTLGAINNQLLKLFETLKTVQKFNDVYVQGTINKVQNLQGKIKSIISSITGILKTLIQRLRNWILNQVKGLIENALENILPPLLKTIKESLGEAIFDQIFCAFENIIKSLANLVGDFVYALIGQIINAPLCAIENWTNALINNLVNQIDAALGPIFDQINDILSGVAQISGSVSSAISYILGFQGFLCGQPNCPELKEFINDLNASVSPTAIDNFNNFNFGVSDSFAGEITQTANEWLGDFFGPDSNTSQSPGSCYTGTFECGIPQIVIFGGGGSGAVAQAVVNNIGQVIGANLLNGGSGYTSTPFVSIVDPAGCGSGASAYAIMGNGENGTPGTVVEVPIGTPGTDNGTTYLGGAPSITSFLGSPNPVVVGNSVSLSWDVVNADSLSLNVTGYTNLPLIGSASIVINESDVTFAAGETETTKTFTLTAEKSNQNSSSQTTTQNFILTVLQEGSSTTSEVNTSTPVIDSFSASPSSVNPGDIVTLSWQSTNSTSTALNVSGLETLPSNGSVSVVIPTDYSFPAGGGNGTETYTLTATNSNAASGSQTDTENVSVTILKPSVISTGIGTTSGTVGSGSTTNVGIQTGDGTGDGTGGGTGAGAGTGTGDGTGNTSGNGNTNAVSVIGDVDIVNTGIGYTAGDTVTVDGGNNGAVFEIQTNPIGQITGINILSSGYGFTTIPRLVVNSSTGLGAQFRTRLRFIPLNQFLRDTQLQTIDPNKLVQIVDCVGTTRATINTSS